MPDPVNESILLSIKKMLGLDEGYDAFDTDVMIHINSALSVLHQLGVAPEKDFYITGDSETWSDLLEDKQHAHLAKTYVFIKVKLVFDPPPTSFALEALNKTAEEYAWRLTVVGDRYPTDLNDS